MEKLIIYFISRNPIVDIKFFRQPVCIGFFLIAAFIPSIIGQGNCLIYSAESGERRACELSYQAIEYPQGSRMSQMLFDSAIAVGPNYAWAYYQKSVPYFKHGLLHEAIQLLNKAVELEPKSYYLCYRAYWYFSHQSYEACIKDLEKYYFEYQQPIEFTPGGDMEMRLLLGLSYARIGDVKKGINIISDCINSYESKDYLGIYDYYILGSLYFEDGQFVEAAKILEQQLSVNPNFADTYYYLGIIKKGQGKNVEARKLFEMAKTRFIGKESGYTRNIWGINTNLTQVEAVLEDLNGST